MKFLRIALVIGSLYFLPCELTAQWNKLPAPKGPWVGSAIYCPGGEPVPAYYIYPASNGEIIYDVECSGYDPSSPSSYEIMESKNDLGADSGEIGFSNGNNGCCYSTAMASYNNSTIAFIVGNDGIPSLYYTANNFSNVNVMSACIASYGGPVAITKNYIYAASQCSFQIPNDFLYISRTNIATNTNNCIKYYTDSSYGKLAFVNDSVGFLISAHRGDFSTIFLLKSSDYGVTWNSIFYDSTHVVTDYCFLSADTGYLIKDNDSLYKTINGGTTWNKLTLPSGSYTCIQFANNQIGYIGGRGGSLIETTNGGTSWTALISGDANTINSLYTFGPSLAYFVDSNKNIYKNQPLSGVVPSTLNIGLFPNPNNGNFTVVLQYLPVPTSLEIYDVLGQRMYNTPLVAGDNNISIQYEQKGIYIYRIIQSNGAILSWGKFVYMGNN
jgi:hypothetical protein